MNSSRRVRTDRLWSAIAYALWIALWILLAALMSWLLTGCSMRSEAPVMQLDSRLTAPCDRPALQGPTNRDVWRLAIEQQEALTDCADRLDVIRGLTRTN
jgi:hypothetical protein